MTPASSVRFDVLTIFPGMFQGALSESILGRAHERGLIDVHLHNLRDWAHDKHHTVDDYPFGGGPGMVMKPEPLFEAIEAVQAMAPTPAFRVFLTPQGRRLDRALVDELAAHERLLLICGRYEGIDERVLDHAVDMQVSIGDFVVSGGELPSMLLIDAVSRRVPGVLGSEGSLDEETFDEGLLEYPQYTRPAEMAQGNVPDVLLSGNHAAIAKWRRSQRIERTRLRRPDLLHVASLTPEEREEVLGDPGYAQVRVGETVFQVRVAAVAVHDGRILLHRVEGDSIWSLPGGRLRVGESSAASLHRTLRAETGAKVEVGEVLWVYENEAFSMRSAIDGPGQGALLPHHEIDIYLDVTFPARLTGRESFRGHDVEHRLEYRWCSARDLDGLDVRPEGILPALRETMAAQ